MPLSQAVAILQNQYGVIDEVQVIYNEKQPFDKDITLNMVNDGVRLMFDAENQRLKIIEVHSVFFLCFQLSHYLKKDRRISTAIIIMRTGRICGIFSATSKMCMFQSILLWLL